MAKQCSAQEATVFWSTRAPSLIMCYKDLDIGIAKYEQQVVARKDKNILDKAAFVKSRVFTQQPSNPVQQSGSPKIEGDISFWIEYNSWTYCSSCQLLARNKLLPNFKNRPANKSSKSCICLANRYTVPKLDEIPNELLNLTSSDVRILRPFIVHTGDYERHKTGYRVKRGMFRLSPQQTTVIDNINAITDRTTRERCLIAYNFLMNNQRSSYKRFIELRNDVVTNETRFNTYNLLQTQGIECALWPPLYPFTEWCESIISGRDSRLSSKKSFLTKVHSQIIDYSLHFDLLLFHYDRWIFKTVTGAMTSARMFKCSPARSLDDKTFSPEYWRWQHRFLLDAVRQFGLPTVFMTFSPYEWSFPFPSWLQNIRCQTGMGPTNLAAYETFHIAHVLEQIVRGYLCGSNDARWSQHIFTYNGKKNMKNIQTYFYRFEFQGRGTVHLHLLVWIKNLAQINYKYIRADIPDNDPDLAFLVHQLQPSDDASPFLHLQTEDTHIERKNEQQLIHLKHPAEAFALNLRAYITTLLPALKCRMDFQTADGNGMLLKYVCSYVSKTHDAFSSRGLYSTYVSPLQAAYRHIAEMKPCEPEMWMSLSALKMSWSCSRTKRYSPPTSSNAELNTMAMKYRQRTKLMEELSFIFWLRTFNTTPKTPAQYKSGNTLVGIKYLSYQNPEYFFQYVLMNKPHRNLNELYHEHHDSLPPSVQFFASAISFNAELWRDVDALKDMLVKEGHRAPFIETTLASIESLHDILTVCQLRMFSVTDFPNTHDCQSKTLSGPQTAIVNTVINCLERRDEYYQAQCCYPDSEGESDSDNYDDSHADTKRRTEQSDSVETCDWTRPILVTGIPGTGKTRAIFAVIEQTIACDRHILMTAPTGFLASKYRETFEGQADADTVHAAFKYPVSEDQRPTINWTLTHYDLIVIDEISMITMPIFHHILKTLQDLPKRPILLLGGDVAQQQPITTTKGKTHSCKSILNEPAFVGMALRYNLTKQFRCIDSTLQRILDHIRYWVPTEKVLNDLQHERVFTHSETPNDNEILSAITTYPRHTFLTISRKASGRVNMLVLNNSFHGVKPLATIQYDCDLPELPLFSNMRVMITQNRDKSQNVVNGQLATVQLVHNRTIFLKLPNNNIVNTYPVTYRNPSGATRTVYPFMPAYALTICKAQGQTLNKAMIWFDVDSVPIATGYVAISRVQKLNDMLFFTSPKKCHFTPNKVNDNLH